MPRVGVEPIRREQIRRAAVQLIADRGFDRTTLREVARSAGVSTGMINHYYPNKIALLVDALIAASEWFQAEIRIAVARAKPGADRFRALVRYGVFNDSQEASIGHSIWAWALAESIKSDELSQVIQERRRLFQDLIADVLRQIEPDWVIDDADLHELAAECDSYFNGLAIHLATGAKNFSADAATASLLSLVVSRLRTGSAPASGESPNRGANKAVEARASSVPSRSRKPGRARKSGRM